MGPLLCRKVVRGVLFVGWAAAYGGPALEPIPVRLHVRDEWVALPSTPDDPQSAAPAMTHAAARISHFVDPESGESYDSKWPFDCTPEQVHHEFRLEKREFLLGEPILVEYLVAVEG